MCFIIYSKILDYLNIKLKFIKVAHMHGALVSRSKANFIIKIKQQRRTITLNLFYLFFITSILTKKMIHFYSNRSLANVFSPRI